MSRIGKKLITLPEKTEISIVDGFIVAKGPLGEIKRNLHPNIEVRINKKEVTVHPKKENLETRALWGTFASHITNMIQGVNKVFEKKLILEGIGFKSEVKGNKIVFEEEAIAFGLKAIIVNFQQEEGDSEIEPIESKINKLLNVNSVEVVDIRRAFG